MKRTQVVIATMLLMAAGTIFAQGPGKGRQTGPRDGSGPIHAPGTGGGTGNGGGNGRMTGPRDGSGPIHAPGTGGGAGQQQGQRRGGRR